MVRTAIKPISLLLIAISVHGCARQSQKIQPRGSAAFSAEEAPRFDLAEESAPTISTVSSRIEPKFDWVDARPELEKNYFPGATDVHHWRDAMTILPMESLQPGFEDVVRKAVLASLQDPLKYERIQVRVNSFHLALDERSQQENRLLYEYKRWDDSREEREKADELREQQQQKTEREQRQMRRSLGLTQPGDENDDDGFGDVLFNGLIEVAFKEPLKAYELRKQKRTRLADNPCSLPTDLTTGKREGWNCYMDVEITFISDEANKKTASVCINKHRRPDESQKAETSVLAIVNSVLSELKSELQSSQF